MLRGRIFVVAVILASAGCTQDAEEVAAQRCKQLREHLVDLRVQAMPAIEGQEAHRAALQQAIGDEFIDTCRKLPASSVECALNASDSAAAGACTSRGESN